MTPNRLVLVGFYVRLADKNRINQGTQPKTNNKKLNAAIKVVFQGQALKNTGCAVDSLRKFELIIRNLSRQAFRAR